MRSLLIVFVMPTMEIIATVGYGLLSIVGGAIGYFKSQSKISLISGGVSGLLLLILAWFQFQGKIWAEQAAIVVIAMLAVVFLIRWFKTKKPIPALPMVVLGVAAIALLLN